MLVGEKLQIPAPRRGVDSFAEKPIRASERKGAAPGSGDYSPHNILPVGRVNRDFPDVVPSRCRPPCHLVRRHTAQRSAQIRPMPRPAVECLIQTIEQETYGSVYFSHILLGE